MGILLWEDFSALMSSEKTNLSILNEADLHEGALEEGTLWDAG